MAISENIPTDKLDLFIELYRVMLTTREIDLLEEQYTSRGEAFFHVSAAGHEAVAALNPHLKTEDWLHCHYRDKALMLARGISTEMFFHSLFCKDASHSRGRQMNAHMSDRENNILSLVGPVGNNALQAVGVAAELKKKKNQSLVLCAFGDGTSQEGEMLEAIAEAVRWELPVLFLIENNQWSISTTTKHKTFFSLPHAEPDSFYNIPIRRVDGRDTLACYRVFEETVGYIRNQCQPAFVQMDVERLSNHTNADDQNIYREEEEIQKANANNDPIPILANQLKQSGVAEETLQSLEAEIKKMVKEIAIDSQRTSDPQPVFDAKKPLPSRLHDSSSEYRGQKKEGTETLTMLEAIKETFRQRMREDKTIFLYGEDIEDPKGDVFGLTRGLTEEFPDQVKNSPLAEATIVGVSVGRALAGGKPVAFLQFADFLPIAFNQIISELGSMYWRTDGAWQCPVIIMITCGGYRPGLGPFHSQTLESIAAHTPGVDVFMPSTAPDAAGLLNAAFDSERPTLFFYPKSCLNDRQVTTSKADIRKQIIPIGKARAERIGQDITFVAWGNTVLRCQQAADALEKVGITATLLDLRSLSPWDEKAVIDSVRITKRLIVAHEDNKSCGLGAEILATVAEKANIPLDCSRVVRSDTYVPCNFANQLEVLPSYKRILTTATELLELDLTWELPPKSDPGIFNVEAVGTSPSDEQIVIVEWHIEQGDHVEPGDLLATFEADKAAADLEASVAGEVLEIVIPEGQSAKVGAVILKLRVAEGNAIIEKPVTQEQPGKPILKRRQRKASSITALDQNSTTDDKGIKRVYKVGIETIGTALGSNVIGNEALIDKFEGKTIEDIERSTGIRNRRRIGENQTASSMALEASREALSKAGLDATELGLVICSTGTPEASCPTVACKVLYGLGREQAECAAYDFSAACSGYIYGLQIAYDFLQTHPDSTVLLITTEVLSPLLDPHDFNTAIIFGDAATATIIRGESNYAKTVLDVHPPELSAQGEPGDYLRVPFAGSKDHIFMEGSKVFSEGVRKMMLMLQRVCDKSGVLPDDLDLIVPHQANQRILNAIIKRLHLPKEKLYSNVKDLGNTSSSTIPLCLVDIIPALEKGQNLGLTAFGGGFTFGACLLKCHQETEK